MTSRRSELPEASQSSRVLKELLGRLSEAEAELLNSIVNHLRRERDNPDIRDVWFPSEDAQSFWILFLNGVDDSEEAALSKSLLFWREFYGGPISNVRCIPSSDRELFRFGSRFFNFSSAPILILSNDPLFEQYLQINAEALAELCKRNAFQRFLTRLHTLIVRGETLSDINRRLRTEGFWRTVQIVYAEIKDFVTIHISG